MSDFGLTGLAKDNFDMHRPVNELDNWLYDNQFDFYIEIGLLTSGLFQ